MTDVNPRQAIEWPGTPERIAEAMLLYGAVYFKPPAKEAGKIVRQQYDAWLADIKRDHGKDSA